MDKKKECCGNCEYCISKNFIKGKGICELEDKFVYLNEKGCDICENIEE